MQKVKQLKNYIKHRFLMVLLSGPFEAIIPSALLPSSVYLDHDSPRLLRTVAAFPSLVKIGNLMDGVDWDLDGTICDPTSDELKIGVLGGSHNKP